MKLSSAISHQIEWSFTNVSHRVGAVPGVELADMCREFGPHRAREIAGVIHALCEQTTAIEREIDWHSHDLGWAQRFVARRLQEGNPGLSQGAAEWIARWFTYQVK